MRNYMWMASVLVLAACQNKDAPKVTPETPAEQIVPIGEIERNPTKNAYFGDLHVHTKNSFDAYIFGTRSSPDDAYRFAKGATIDNGAGHDISLYGPPLDFLSVTDHGEYIGIVEQMATRGTPLSKTATAKSIFGIFAKDRRQNFLKIGRTIVNGDEIADIYDQPHMNEVWAETIAAAERHNNPGQFTAFSGYEFTAMLQVTATGAANLHRNVIFKNEAPARLFTTLDSPNPEDLWDWMNQNRAKGIESLAIPHNSNASNGQMFADLTYEGGVQSADYARNRLANEPLVEITQVKGTSETHPLLSPNDEWADFEIYDNLIGSTEKSIVDVGSFVRTTLARGLGREVNPYAFGFVGSSDTHLGAGSMSEEHHFGKFPHDMEPENRQSTPPKGAKNWDKGGYSNVDLVASPQYGASGLAGVWAEANTRDDLFGAMRAKETFGTSGPRIRVRMFAGDYDDSVLDAADMLEQAYARGTPMGGKAPQTDTSPDFLVWAMQDPNGMSLQRLQIIKVWQENGENKERIFDLACADGAAPDTATRRCADNGAVVDLADCSTNPETGAAELKAIWQDPDYQQGEVAAYYTRVLENPKCRWSSWDAARNGSPVSPEMKPIVQDRAWGSPIWIGSSHE